MKQPRITIEMTLDQAGHFVDMLDEVWTEEDSYDLDQLSRFDREHAEWLIKYAKLLEHKIYPALKRAERAKKGTK